MRLFCCFGGGGDVLVRSSCFRSLMTSLPRRSSVRSSSSRPVAPGHHRTRSGAAQTQAGTMEGIPEEEEGVAKAGTGPSKSKGKGCFTCP